MEGAYQGKVTRSKSSFTVKVAVPSVFGSKVTVEANPAHAVFAPPLVGDIVWVVFAHGDTSYPLYFTSKNQSQNIHINSPYTQDIPCAATLVNGLVLLSGRVRNNITGGWSSGKNIIGSMPEFAYTTKWYLNPSAGAGNAGSCSLLIDVDGTLSIDTAASNTYSVDLNGVSYIRPY